MAMTTDPRSQGWSGGAVAFSIAFVAALIGLGFDTPFLLIGIPAATMAGWRLGPKVPASGGIVGMAVALAVVTVAIADALVVIASAATSVAFGGSDLLTMIAGSAILWSVGFVIYGLPMLVITVPCGLIWAVLVQRLARACRPLTHSRGRSARPA